MRPSFAGVNKKVISMVICSFFPSFFSNFTNYSNCRPEVEGTWHLNLLLLNWVTGHVLALSLQVRLSELAFAYIDVCPGRCAGDSLEFFCRKFLARSRVSRLSSEESPDSPTESRCPLRTSTDSVQMFFEGSKFWSAHSCFGN